MKIIKSNLCTFCENEDEPLIHFFYKCVKVKPIIHYISEQIIAINILLLYFIVTGTQSTVHVTVKYNIFTQIRLHVDVFSLLEYHKMLMTIVCPLCYDSYF